MKIVISLVVSIIIIILLIAIIVALVSFLINCQVSKGVCQAVCHNGDRKNSNNMINEQNSSNNDSESKLMPNNYQKQDKNYIPKSAPLPTQIITSTTTPKQQPSKPQSIKPTQKTNNIWVDEHNRIRADVGLGPIAWNEDIASGAKKHAETCKFEHSSNNERQFGSQILGENLGYGSPYDNFTDKQMIKMWEDEKAHYKHPQKPSESATGVTGHYTQIVNKNVTELGCGCANCGGKKQCVCRYNPIQLGSEPPY